MPTEHIALSFVAGPLAGRNVELPLGDTMTFGTAADRDCVLAGDPRVSPRHAMLSSDSTGVWLVDETSDHGTFVNGEKISRRRVIEDDRVLIGATIFDIRLEAQDMPGGMLAQAVFSIQTGDRSGQHLTVEQGTYVVGRSEIAADLWLDDASVSRRHAELTVGGGRVTVVDLDTISGTRVNGEPVGSADDAATIAVGDTLQLGNISLRLDSFVMAGTATIASAPVVPPAALGAHGVLAGSLEQIALPDVLQILGTARQSGCLVVQGAEQTLRVFFVEGRIHGAIADGGTTDPTAAAMRETLVTAAELRVGTFHFDPMVGTELGSPIDADVNAVLMDLLAPTDGAETSLDLEALDDALS